MKVKDLFEEKEEAEVLSADDLDTYAENTKSLYDKKIALVKRMSKAMDAGKYDKERAYKAFVRHFKAVASEYHREIDKTTIITPETIRAAAKAAVAHEEGMIKRGEYRWTTEEEK